MSEVTPPPLPPVEPPVEEELSTLRQETPREKRALSRAERDEKIKRYAHLVDKVASRAISRLPRSIELDDVKSAGMIGLIDAIDKYSEDKGRSFSVYAEIRIRGAIMDELRALDWVPRSVREHAQRIARAERALIARLDRAPTQQELAEALELSREELSALQKKAKIQQVTFYQDMRRGDGELIDDPLEVLRVSETQEETPDRALLEDEELERSRLALKRLPERLRMVTSLYYFEEMKLKDIGELLGVTESRVSQLLSHALRELRAQLDLEEEP